MGTPINEGGDSGGINPAWNDMLNVIPEDAREAVIPHLKTWDQNFQTEVQKAQQEWEPFKEFKGFNPEDLRMGVGLLQAINTDPRKVYEALAEQFDLGTNNAPPTGQGVPGQPQQQNLPPGFENLPPEVIQQLQQQQQHIDTLSQWALQQNETKAQQAEDEALSKQMADLKGKHGEFNEMFVLSQMHAGMTPDDAVKSFRDLEEQIAVNANRPQAPKILGSGSAIPGEQRIDVTKLDPKGTKDLVAQMLAATAKANQT